MRIFRLIACFICVACITGVFVVGFIKEQCPDCIDHPLMTVQVQFALILFVIIFGYAAISYKGEE